MMTEEERRKRELQFGVGGALIGALAGRSFGSAAIGGIGGVLASKLIRGGKKSRSRKPRRKSPHRKHKSPRRKKMSKTPRRTG